MNLKILAIFILFNWVEKSYGQRMYVVPNFEIQYSGISYVKKREKNKSDFTPSKPKINGTWGVDIYYQSKKTIYRFSIQREILGEAFGIKNKFFNLEKDLGIIGHQTSSGVEHYVMSCNLGNGDSRFRNFIFKNKVKFTYAIGIGIGFNRQKSFYQEQYYYRTGGRADAYSYISYEEFISRKGLGFFISGSGGVDMFSKKLNRLLCFSLFYNQGLKQMVKYDIHYQYGFFNDPQKQTDVPSQILRSRGTTFGFKLGVPIRIIK